MKTIRTAALMAAALLPAAARGEDWPPLPADVWAMKEDPAKGIKGAVVLEERVRIDRFGVTYTYRVRILSEAGKAGAEFRAFPSNLQGFAGRTVYPDGKVLAYSSAKDFLKKTSVSLGESNEQRLKVVAPGVTADCVVDLKWTVPQNFVDKGFSSFKPGSRWRFINPYPTRRLVVEMPVQFPLSWNLEQYPGQESVEAERGGLRSFTWTDLPAEEDIPYVMTQARKAPALSLYDTPSALQPAARLGHVPFWDAFAEQWVRRYFEERVNKGGDYKDFVAELGAGLPATPQARATELLTRLDGRMQNYAALTFAERAALGKALEEDIEVRDLKGAVKRKGTSGFGMTMFYYHAAKDLGLQPRILLVVDRDERIFNYRNKDHAQFSDILLAFPEEGKRLLVLDPSLRFTAPGLVIPEYQGVPALDIDTTTWKAKSISIATQPAAFNQRRYTTTLELQEEEDRFTLKADFAGYPEFSERRQVLRLEATEQQRILKERLEGISKAYAITKAEILNVANPKESFGWRVEGRIERAPGRRREVLPFPGVGSALAIPAELPAERTENICLPYARTLLATCTFKVPKDYVLGTIQPIRNRNGFGRVDWTVDIKEEDGTQSVTVQMRVDVETAMARATGYEGFKEFLGWIQEAGGRTLILDKR